MEGPNVNADITAAAEIVVEIAAMLSDLEAIDRQLSRLDDPAERARSLAQHGPVPAAFHAARARAELTLQAADIADELAGLYEDAGDPVGAVTAQTRHEAYLTQAARYVRAREAIRSELYS